MSDTNVESPLLTTAEAADYLRVSAYTVRRWCREGRLPSHRIGGQKLAFKKKDLDRFIERSRR